MFCIVFYLYLYTYSLSRRMQAISVEDDASKLFCRIIDMVLLESGAQYGRCVMYDAPDWVCLEPQNNIVNITRYTTVKTNNINENHCKVIVTLCFLLFSCNVKISVIYLTDIF